MDARGDPIARAVHDALALEVLFFFGFVVLGLWRSRFSAADSFFGIRTPAGARINKVGLSLQSLRHHVRTSCRPSTRRRRRRRRR